MMPVRVTVTSNTVVYCKFKKKNFMSLYVLFDVTENFHDAIGVSVIYWKEK